MPHYGVQSVRGVTVREIDLRTCGVSVSVFRERWPVAVSFTGPHADANTKYDLSAFSLVDTSGKSHPALCYRDRATSSSRWEAIHLREGAIVVIHTTKDFSVDLLFAMPAAPSTEMTLTLGRTPESLEAFPIASAALR